MPNMDHDDEGLLFACQMYEMTLINLITMNDVVHHPCVVGMWRRVNSQSEGVFWANVRKKQDVITGIRRERGG
jgi:hypothetical protein